MANNVDMSQFEQLSPESESLLANDERRDKLREQYQTALQNVPQISDFHPSLGRRVLGALGQTQFEYEPYYRQFSDYLKRTEGMRRALDYQDSLVLRQAQITHLGAQALAEGARRRQEEATEELRRRQAMPEYNIERYGYQPKTLQEREELDLYAHPEQMRPISVSGSAIFNPFTQQLEQNPYYVPPARMGPTERLDLHKKEREFDIEHPIPAREQSPKKLNLEEARKRVFAKNPKYQQFYKQNTKTKKFEWVPPDDPKLIPLYNQMLKDIQFEMGGGAGLHIEEPESQSRYEVEEINEEE
jgi:hypothetical protein